MSERYIGIDLGAETIKIVELERKNNRQKITKKEIIEHHNEPGSLLVKLLDKCNWGQINGASVTGRFSRLVNLPRVPIKQAQTSGFRFLYGNDPATVVSIGSHGFSVLELRQSGIEIFRENSRCSQGTGNFLRQLVERFNLSIEEASKICEDIEEPAYLSGRCPVILKTDMTHLANKGESRQKILAGLFDAVCSNVQVLIKPGVCPAKVALIGGVSRSKRVREQFKLFLDKNGMQFIPYSNDNALFIEGIGTALHAVAEAQAVPDLNEIVIKHNDVQFDKTPQLSSYLSKVKRMPQYELTRNLKGARELIIGFDMGSTGSKALAIDRFNNNIVWEGYNNTNGNPVGAAQILMNKFINSEAGEIPVVALGVTGSGREIVGSLMANCYGKEQIFILNEIAAHAEGALHFDKRVDTIFEIGGQDAKYIRLSGGRVIDAAMNEACSAGTGSFIEEQGKKFSKIENVMQLGEQALEAECGVSLGQHCSVFMAEIIDEAVAAGVENASIIAGIYDSIIQNYLNRVKCNRSVGDVIFCQGMPFTSDALASAVVQQTDSEVIIPPNPGTIGALGIALLTKKEIKDGMFSVIDPERFLRAEISSKDTFICNSKKGCGGSGNHCRIDRITTLVDNKKQNFTWGGGCSLWDKGTRIVKLPDRAPDPFKEREALIEGLIKKIKNQNNRKKIALTDEFQLKGLFPFFLTFIQELGFDILAYSKADHSILKRGIEKANIPFCAPMQQYHGIVSTMAESNADYLFLPMLRSICRDGCEPNSKVCPIVQGSTDILKWDLGKKHWNRIVSPVIDIDIKNLESKLFLECCKKTARALGKNGKNWLKAYHSALRVQRDFDKSRYEIGRRALDFCKAHSITPVLVQGRPYTIYNKVLNSNVPAILREQGSIAIPIDCFEIKDDVPIFEDMYWGYGQVNLRAAHQIRRTRGIYSIWCSNYSCGPDSFNLHFFGYIMQGKPFTIIETDGHSGDAGTKTRVEVFLHCVKEDLLSIEKKKISNFKKHQRDRFGLIDIHRNREILLIPFMGEGTHSLAASLRGFGFLAEALPMPTRETLQLGRRYTSGKECFPIIVTMGGLLERIEKNPEQEFVFLMPTAEGPCRFGVYHLLFKTILEHLGRDNVRVLSPNDDNYFEGLPAGISVLILVGITAEDMLLAALYDTRPVENKPGAALAVYRRYVDELHHLLENAGIREELTIGNALKQVMQGRMFGCADLVKRASYDFAKIKSDKSIPIVSMVGEIYVRSEPFSNDFIVEKLEERGIGVRFAPCTEWLEYTDYNNRKEGRVHGFGAQLSAFVQQTVQARLYNLMGFPLNWHNRTTVKDTMNAANPYIRKKLNGEAILTLGGPLHEWRQGLIDGVVVVGPLECMPTKIAETQFFHVAEQEGLLSLVIPYNGDPVDDEVIDNFAFEIKSCFKKRYQEKYLPKASGYGRNRIWG